MMDTPASPGTAADDDVRKPLRGLFAAAIETMRTRLDLAAVELEIYLLVLVRTMVWAIGAIVCVLTAFALALTALVVSLWDTHRMLALLGGSGAFVALAVLFGWLGARALRVSPGMFSGSLQQLREDQRRAGGAP